MTAKEKAFKLYFKFYRDIIADNNKAKQSALIAVDECLNTCVESMIIYWIEVKEQIELL